MTTFTQSVQVRRITYGGQSQPLTASVADDPSDNSGDMVLDPVMLYDPYWTISGYHWDWNLGCQVLDEIQ